MAGKAEGQQGTVWGPAEHLGTPLGALRACGSLTQPLRLSWWVCPNIPRSHLHPLLLPRAVCGEEPSASTQLGRQSPGPVCSQTQGLLSSLPPGQAPG